LPLMGARRSSRIRDLIAAHSVTPDPLLFDDLGADIGRSLAQISLAVGNLADHLHHAGPHAGEFLRPLRRHHHDIGDLIHRIEAST